MSLLTVLLPQRCAICSRPGAAVCDPCLAGLVRIGPPVCERCGPRGRGRCAAAPNVPDDGSHSHPCGLRSSTRIAPALSWGRGKSVVAATWPPSQADLVARAVPCPAVDALCPVPGDRDRGLQRGHASAARLAHELSTRWELPVLELLRRRPGVDRQRGLPRATRRANVARAFVPAARAPRRCASSTTSTRPDRPRPPARPS